MHAFYLITKHGVHAQDDAGQLPNCPGSGLAEFVLLKFDELKSTFLGPDALLCVFSHPGRLSPQSALHLVRVGADEHSHDFAPLVLHCATATRGFSRARVHHGKVRVVAPQRRAEQAGSLLTRARDRLSRQPVLCLASTCG